MERIDALLEFWFGTEPDDGAAARARATLWFGGGAEVDHAVRGRFAADLERASRGELDTWSRFPHGRLALIILLDQFSRMIHRGTARAFAQDAAALRACQEGLALGADRTLRPIERVFFYLPLEHAEDPAAQEESVRRFTDLFTSVGPGWKTDFGAFLDYAVRHRDVIARFGRFPHRNAVLGRPSTAEEIAFLREQPRGF